MFRRLAFFSVGAIALVYALSAPERVHGQGMRGRMRMGAPMHMPMPMNRTFNPGLQSGFLLRSTFDPRFRSMFFSPSFMDGRGTFDRFEDRFRFGSLDRFEDRLENRLRFGGFGPGLNGNSMFFDPRLNSNSMFFDQRLGGTVFVPPFMLGF
jgi:hypothetical protein